MSWFHIAAVLLDFFFIHHRANFQKSGLHLHLLTHNRRVKGVQDGEGD